MAIRWDGHVDLKTFISAVGVYPKATEKLASKETEHVQTGKGRP